MEREELIALCERAIVPVENWTSSNTVRAQQELGKLQVLLKSGADFKVVDTKYSDDIGIEVSLKKYTFPYKQRVGRAVNSEMYIIPSKERLDALNGLDWLRY